MDPPGRLKSPLHISRSHTDFIPIHQRLCPVSRGNPAVPRYRPSLGPSFVLGTTEDVYVKSESDPGPSNTDPMRQDWRPRKSISSDDTEGGMVPHKVRNISLQDNTDSKQLSEAEYRNRVLLSQTNHGEIKQEVMQEPEYYARPQQQRVQYNQDPLRLDNQRDAIYDNMLTPSQSFNNNRYAPNPSQLGTQPPSYRHQRGGSRENIDWYQRPG